MKIIILYLFTIAASASKAQTFEEWFRQKETQKKYLLEQIAALKVYGSYLQKGYTIAKDGLRTVQSIKSSDLSLHTDYFHSLKTVNPAIKRYPHMKEIIGLQKQISRLADRSKKLFTADSFLTVPERLYVSRTFDRLLEDCHNTLEELERVTGSGDSSTADYQMKDDERIKRIDQLYADTQSQWRFVRSFSNEVAALSLARTQEQNNIRNSRLLHGIK